uniref:Uncharacterized protein n=1 Tax=viral metagenome TaxID=1070528 RepID=A0A6C0J407_9ZZZZ
MDIRIDRACNGATRANGGMNIKELRQYLSSLLPALNVKLMNRNDIIGYICKQVRSKPVKPVKSIKPVKLVKPVKPVKPVKTKLPTTIKVTNVRKDGHVTVTIPTHMQNMFSMLPDLDREYGGLIDYNLNGKFESISLISGAQNTIEAKEIPDYETMWHNHPTESSGVSLPSIPDIANLISRTVQVSLIFVKKGTFVQSTVDKKKSRILFEQLMADVHKKDKRSVHIVDKITDVFTIELHSIKTGTITEKYIKSVKKLFDVDTVFFPFGELVTFDLIPFEPLVHKVIR